MFQEGNLGKWRLKFLKEGEEERPWFTKQGMGGSGHAEGEVGRRFLRHSQGLGRRGREGVISDMGGANWARAEVVEIGSGLVKLFFIDLGDQGWVRQENLRELPSFEKASAGVSLWSCQCKQCD